MIENLTTMESNNQITERICVDYNLQNAPGQRRRGNGTVKCHIQ